MSKISLRQTIVHWLGLPIVILDVRLIGRLIMSSIGRKVVIGACRVLVPLRLWFLLSNLFLVVFRFGALFPFSRKGALFFPASCPEVNAKNDEKQPKYFDFYNIIYYLYAIKEYPVLPESHLNFSSVPEAKLFNALR